MQADETDAPPLRYDVLAGGFTNALVHGRRAGKVAEVAQREQEREAATVQAANCALARRGLWGLGFGLLERPLMVPRIDDGVVSWSPLPRWYMGVDYAFDGPRFEGQVSP